MANSSTILRGFLGTDPKNFEAKGVQGASFRLACTRRFFDKKTQQWKDSPTTWITVRAFRALAGNIVTSLAKGEPVIVYGELTTDKWSTQEGEMRTSMVLLAQAVGHDLNQGSTVFTRIRRDISGMVDTEWQNNQKQSNEQAVSSHELSDESEENIFESEPLEDPQSFERSSVKMKQATLV